MGYLTPLRYELRDRPAEPALIQAARADIVQHPARPLAPGIYMTPEEWRKARTKKSPR
jgi:hypothetical protein